MACVVCRGIDIIDELDCVECEEAEAKCIQIAEQSTEAICRSSTKEAGSIVVQEVWLCFKGKVGVFNQSFMVNDVGNQLIFLDVGSVGSDIAVGGLLKS